MKKGEAATGKTIEAAAIMDVLALTKVDIPKFAGLHHMADQFDLVAIAVVFEQHVKAAALAKGLYQAPAICHSSRGRRLGDDTNTGFQRQGRLLGMKIMKIL